MRSRALSLGEARRIALAAQQFGTASGAPRDVAGISELVRRLGAVQIDSVNVLVRSHYLPTHSRFGPYDSTLLDRAAYADGERTLFEYWGHEASLMPIRRESWKDSAVSGRQARTQDQIPENESEPVPGE